MTKSFNLSFLRSRAAQKRIAAVTLACAVAGGVYAFTLPNWFRSVLTVVPSSTPPKGGIAGALGAAAMASAGLDALSADTARIAAVLQSTTVADAVIEKFDLRTRYRAPLQETAREALWSHCTVKALPKPNLVQLSCEDKDPRFAQQMLGFMAEHANQVFRRVGFSSASEEVRFLEKRVAELRQQADDTANRMRTFQETYKIVDLDAQAKAVVSSLAALQRERINKQLELAFARTFSSRDESTIQQLRSQLGVVDDKLHDLELHALEDTVPPAPRPEAKRDAKHGDMFPAALHVPKLRAEFETLFRDRKVAEATLVFALERLEAAKAEEARDVSTFQILDPPTLPTRRARPVRRNYIFAAALIGLVATLGYEWWRRGGATAALRTVLGELEDRPPAPVRPAGGGEQANSVR